MGDLGSGTSGNDYITNFENDATIDALAGNDTIANGGDRFSVNAGAGSDTVHNYGAFATVNAGAGNDSVDNYTVSAFIDGDAGNDKLYTYRSDSVTLGGGDGNDNLVNEYGSSVSLDGGAGSDTVHNYYGNHSTLNGGNGADFLYNSGGDFTTLDGGDDNDFIDNSNAYNASAVGGAGDDSIRNFDGHYSTLDGGEGNDSVDNLYSDGVSVGAGAGLDSVLSNSFFVTVDGGADNDRISLQASGHLIRYAAGEGSDTVFGFNESDTLTIAADSYSTKRSGDNVIVTVGNETISLVGAAYKKLNINATDRTDLITLTKDNDIFRNNFSNVTINAGTGDDSVTNYAAGVTLNGDDGNDSLINLASDTTINGGKGNEYISNSNAKASINGDAGNDYLYNSYGNFATVNGGAGNDTVYNYVSDNASIEGGAGHDSLYNFYSTGVTINGGSGKDSVTNIYSKSVTIDGGAGDDFISNESSDNVTINGGGDNDTVQNDGAGVLVDGGDGNDSLSNSGTNVTLNGGMGHDSVSNSGTDVTVDGGKGKDFIYNVGNKVSVFGGDDQDIISLESSASRALDSTVNGGKGNDTIYGNSAAGGSYKYTKGDGKDVIYGFNTASTLFIARSTWATGQSDNDIIVTVGSGTVTLKDAADLSEVHIVTDTEPGVWSVNKTQAIYTGLDGTVLTKVSGLISGLEAVDGKIDGIALEGMTVTLSANVLTTTQVTISGGYVLALNEDVPLPVPEPEQWHFSGTKTTTAKYRADTPAGYSLSNDATAINYVKEKTGKTLVTVTGLKGGLTDADKDGLKLDGTTVTVSANVLNTDPASAAEVTTEGYTLALANDVPVPTPQTPFWTLNSNKTNTTAKLNQDVKDGYTLNKNNTAIKYNVAKTGKTTTNLTTVSGLKGGLTDANGLAFDEDAKTVTLSANVLDPKNTVTITKDYKLALGDDVSKSIPQNSAWSVKGTTAKFTADMSIGYYCTDKEIRYYAKIKKNMTLISVSGLKKGLEAVDGKIDGIALEGTKVTLSANVLAANNVAINSGYTLALDYDVPTPVIEPEAWHIKGTTAKFSADTSAGYKPNKTSTEIAYVGAKSGKAIISVNGLAKGLNDADGIELDEDTKTVTLSANVLDPKKTATVTNGYTLALASDVPTPVIESEAWSASNTTAKLTANKSGGYILDKNAVTYKQATTEKLTTISGLRNRLTLNSYGTIDGMEQNGKTISLSNSILGNNVKIGQNYAFDFTADCKGASITGTSKDDTINVEGSNMTVTGGRGNDFVMLGGRRNTFAYGNGDGNDVIADFTADDRIKITSGSPLVSTSGNTDVVLLNANNQEIPYNITTSYLLADANYVETAQLDTLVENAATDYSTGKLDATDPTALATNDVIVTYGSDK